VGCSDTRLRLFVPNGSEGDPVMFIKGAGRRNIEMWGPARSSGRTARRSRSTASRDGYDADESCRSFALPALAAMICRIPRRAGGRTGVSSIGWLLVPAARSPRARAHTGAGPGAAHRVVGGRAAAGAASRRPLARCADLNAAPLLLAHRARRQTNHLSTKGPAIASLVETWRSRRRIGARRDIERISPAAESRRDVSRLHGIDTARAHPVLAGGQDQTSRPRTARL